MPSFDPPEEGLADVDAHCWHGEQRVSPAREDFAEQAAVARVARAVAVESDPHVVLTVIAEEIARLVGFDGGGIVRFDAEGTGEVLAVWAGERDFREGIRFPLDDTTAAGRVYLTGTAQQISTYERASGEIGGELRRVGMTSGTSVPVRVHGALWGSISTTTVCEGCLQPGDIGTARALRRAGLALDLERRRAGAPEPPRRHGPGHGPAQPRRVPRALGEEVARPRPLAPI